MDMAEEAIVANGVVYTYGSGENTEQQRRELAWDEKPSVTVADGPPAMGGAELTPEQLSAVAAFVWSLSHHQ